MKKKILTKNFVILCLSSLGYMCASMLTTPLIAGFAKSIGAKGVLMGIMGSASHICAFICRPILGNITEKYTKHALTSFGSLVVALSCLGYMFCTNNVVLFCLRIVNGIGYACCTVCASTWAGSLLPKENIKSGMGIFGTMNALGMAISPFIGVSISEKYGYKAAFAVAMCASLVCFAGIQFVTDKGIPTRTLKAKSKVEIVYIKAIPMAVCTTFFTIPYYGLQSFLVSYISDRNLNVNSGAFFPIYAAFLLLLRITLKKQFDTKPYSLFVIISNISMVLCMLCLWKMDNYLLMIPAALFMALSYGIMCTASQGAAMSLAEDGKSGLANSTYYLGLDTGMSLGPLIGGVFYENFPIDGFFLYFIIFPPICVFVYQLLKKLSFEKKQ